jgi:octaprenyl-diphosphate synthase
MNASRQFGRLLGEAFQVADDVLDITGTSRHLGKPVGADLQQGLITLPVILYAQAHADDERLSTVLGHKADSTTIHALVAAIRAERADELAMHRAKAHVDEAINLLHVYAATPYREALEEIARFAIQRQV